jgi:hypothetical protein
MAEPVATSTTRRTLWRMLAVLLGLTAMVLGASVSVMAGTSRTAETVRDRSAPSILELASVRTAMIRADAAAIDSFRTGRARLAGPGDDYQRYLATATQGLAEAAGDVTAGEDSSLKIQLVEGQIVSYTGLVAQAQAHYRQDAADSLPTVYLWYASVQLHGSDGILDQLDLLAKGESDSLGDRLSGGWLSPWATVLWVAPIGILLVALGYAQWFLGRRFRRRLNAWLLAATVLLVGLGAGTSLALVSKSRLGDTRDTLASATQLAKQQGSGVDTEGQSDLARMLRGQCPHEATECGYSVQKFLSAPVATAATSTDVAGAAKEQTEDNKMAADGRMVNREAGSASRVASYALIALAVALLIGVTVWLGLRPRLEEYRFRPR